MKIGRVLFVALLVVAGSLVAHAAPVAAVTPTMLETHVDLGQSGIMDMAIDAAHSHVFVSVTSENAVKVLSFDGTLVTTISVLDASGLAINGSHLYVQQQYLGSITDIDTASLTVSGVLAHDLGDIYRLEYAGGALWTRSSSQLVRISTTDGSTQAYSDPVASGGVLEADPTDSNTLFDWNRSSPSTLARLNVGSLPPTVQASENDGTVASNLNDIAVSRDGTKVVVAGGSPYEYTELKRADLTTTGLAYPGDAYPEQVATNIAGPERIATLSRGDDAVVNIFPAGGSTPVATWSSSEVNGGGGEGALQYSPDGTRLFFLTSAFVNRATLFVLQEREIGASASSLNFGSQRIGTYGAAKTVTLTNFSDTAKTVNDITIGGSNPADFFGGTNCFPSGAPRSLASGASCKVTLYFGAVKLGGRKATLNVSFTGTASPVKVSLSGNGTEGYVVAGAYGEIGTFGDAGYYGDATRIHLKAPMIALATTTNGGGYWMLGRDGGIFTYGNARFYGSTGAMKLKKPIVSMAPTPTGKGYWLVASDGGIFSFGDARFFGSTGALRLPSPVVGMVAAPDGKGYWMVRADGAVYHFGSAKYYGQALGAHGGVAQITATPTGKGYRFVTRDGHMYAFGDAHNFGSPVGRPVVGMAVTPDGKGYWVASRDGRIAAFGDAHNYGDLGGQGINDMIAIAGSAPPLPKSLLSPTAANALGRSCICGLAANQENITGHVYKSGAGT